ncbi:hypothetical protein UlMin_021882 [Ulmus minor]
MGTNKSNPISVEQYTPIKRNFIDLSQENFDDDDVEVQVLWLKSPNTCHSNRRKPFADPSVTETGQSSNSNNYPPFACEICAEDKSANESFSVQGCDHAYCTDCVIRYVDSKLQDNITNIRCPVSGCKGLLEPDHCRLILPQEVFDRWGSALCEAFILDSEKFYCPFKDCSALMIDDGKEIIKESECPNCKRLFCAQCKVPWHTEFDCGEFQNLNKDERENEDIMLIKLAEKHRWRRCPNCRFYVEKSTGCLFMLCRCGVAFCYGCGMINKSKNHYCDNCRR